MYKFDKCHQCQGSVVGGSNTHALRIVLEGRIINNLSETVMRPKCF